jgi:acetylglutamate/LysW-gamma-L-alpha-aminoadipate kinase
MIVIKIGGASGVNMPAICQDVAEIMTGGQQVILVHGGSAETNVISEKLGYPPRFITSPAGFTSRYTDRPTLEIFAMVTAGKINKLLVEMMQKAGVNAFGCSGVDGQLMVARRKDAVRSIENGRQRIIRDDYTGKIEKVNSHLLDWLVQAGCLPVIAPLAISPDGEMLNVDADRAAAMVAGAVRAEQLLLLTNVPGLLRHYPDETSLIPHIDRVKVEQAMAFAEGRMKKKVLGACEALELGVGKVVFADGRGEHPVQNALAGHGTVIS